MTYIEWLEQRAEAGIRATGRMPLDVHFDLTANGYDSAKVEQKIRTNIEQEQLA